MYHLFVLSNIITTFVLFKPFFVNWLELVPGGFLEVPGFLYVISFYFPTSFNYTMYSFQILF